MQAVGLNFASYFLAFLATRQRKLQSAHESKWDYVFEAEWSDFGSAIDTELHRQIFLNLYSYI